MSGISRIVLAGAIVALSGTFAMADGHLEKAVKARKAVMTLYSHSLGTLGAMAKGEMEYNSEAASAAAANLAALASLDQSTMWPQGTDSDSMESSRALPKIWTTYPAVAEKSKAMVDSANAMAAAAGTDLAALRGAIGAVGGACKGCHENFRKPKE